ncbi:subunit 17 of mediator complex-domain-containing protein [Amanita rubescens]|nr:subunit 17 of mediator complex-domain-containing protein [Amanita rubescens]
MEEPSWKMLKLSLERPYKDDNDDPIPVLSDIAADGQYIYEPKETLTQQLGEKLHRIFVERGVDFFEKGKGRSSGKPGALAQDMDIDLPHASEDPSEEKATTATMTTEDLLKMRMEILPHLYIALGEMSHAKDLLSSLLATKSPPDIPVLRSTPTGVPPSSHLSATVVNKPPSITSVQAFNAQLIIGGKDEALRKAADVFKTAAENMEKTRQRGEKYWLDALKIRRANWRLVPAPTGKGTDKTAKDFLIVYGLEESPAIFRRQAIAHMATNVHESDNLIFPYRRHTRLRISIMSTDGNRVEHQSPNSSPDESDLNAIIHGAQQEIIEQEIFSLLVKEAASLPTASARVSEMAVFIDAAPGMELQFELVNSDRIEPAAQQETGNPDNICDLIYHGLHVLLLRRHNFLKMQRLRPAREANPANPPRVPPVLQPIIGLLQYQVFCRRIKLELDKVTQALAVVSIISSLRFTPVGETGQDLLDLADKGESRLMSGEALIRIDNRYGIRLSFEAPSSLTAHLSQATIAITSVPQLCQLLRDEVENCLLQRICDVGKSFSEGVGGTWFVDLNRCVGRWDGCVLNFRILYGDDFAIDCVAFRLDDVTGRHGRTQSYSADNTRISLFEWIARITQAACERRL